MNFERGTMVQKRRGGGVRYIVEQWEKLLFLTAIFIIAKIDLNSGNVLYLCNCTSRN